MSGDSTKKQFDELHLWFLADPQTPRLVGTLKERIDGEALLSQRRNFNRSAVAASGIKGGGRAKQKQV